MIILSMILTISLLINILSLMKLNSRPTIEKIEYKEIEVIKRAICECDHPSSFHNEKGCRHIKHFDVYRAGGFIRLPDYCECKRYTGPTPITEYFADQLELESERI